VAVSTQNRHSTTWRTCLLLHLQALPLANTMSRPQTPSFGDRAPGLQKGNHPHHRTPFICQRTKKRRRGKHGNEIEATLFDPTLEPDTQKKSTDKHHPALAFRTKSPHAHLRSSYRAHTLPLETLRQSYRTRTPPLGPRVKTRGEAVNDLKSQEVSKENYQALVKQKEGLMAESRGQGDGAMRAHSSVLFGNQESHEGCYPVFEQFS
jgi:hypothetical protein